ncbi:MAG: adenosine deaminase [Candidatus Diapherotrites archaeon]
MKISKFIKELPKAELHVHIEGTLEPALLLSMARKNKIRLKYGSVSALKKAYRFGNLQEFLDIYYEGCKVLLAKKDFCELTLAYFSKAHEQGIRHVELFFDPQSHTARGVPFQAIIEGIHEGRIKALKRFSISSKIIMCFLRHLPESEAEKTLREAVPYRKWIEAVGLDSSESGNPPSKFTHVFSQARKAGFRAVAHAGEEGPAAYVSQAVSRLKVSRIDHGNHALDNPKLVGILARKHLPLTVCPISNWKLRVVKDLRRHPLRKMMDAGLLVTINSDDPAYFGGYLGENYQAMKDALGLSKEELIQLAKNSFEASFLPRSRKKYFMRLIDSYAENSASFH